MTPVTITSWELCRKAILPPGTSRMKWRFSSRSAWVLFRARSTSAAAPIHSSTLSASGILTALRMDLHGTDEVELEHGLYGVVEQAVSKVHLEAIGNRHDLGLVRFVTRAFAVPQTNSIHVLFSSFSSSRASRNRIVPGSRHARQSHISRTGRFVSRSCPPSGTGSRSGWRSTGRWRPHAPYRPGSGFQTVGP